MWYHEELLHGGSEAPGPHQGGRKTQRRGTRDNGSESVSRWTDARGGDSPWATVYEAGVDPSGSQMLPWPWQPHSLPPKLARPSQGTLGAEGSWEAVVLSSTGGGGDGAGTEDLHPRGSKQGRVLWEWQESPSAPPSESLVRTYRGGAGRCRAALLGRAAPTACVCGALPRSAFSTVPDLGVRGHPGQGSAAPTAG